MKKLVAALLAAFVMSAGLVATTTTSASAACPYAGCVDTVTVSVATVNQRKDFAKVGAKVRAVGSNARPPGRFVLTIKRKGGTKVLYRATKSVPKSQRRTFETRKFRKGRYQYAVRYFKKPGSGYNNSISKGFFTVK